MAVKPHKQLIGGRLRMAMEAKGLRNVDVVDAFRPQFPNLTSSKLGNWLRGDNLPDSQFLDAFCERYGFTTDWILRGKIGGMTREIEDALWRRQAPTSSARAS